MKKYLFFLAALALLLTTALPGFTWPWQNPVKVKTSVESKVNAGATAAQKMNAAIKMKVGGEALSENSVGIRTGETITRQTVETEGDKITHEGDEIKSYILAAPHTVASDGQQAFSAYSIFGGINVAQTEEARRCEDNIKLLVLMAANEIIDADELRDMALVQYFQILTASRPKRLFGLLWQTTGAHALNGWGAFAWDDLYVKFCRKTKARKIAKKMSGRNSELISPDKKKKNVKEIN